jgi:TrmH family RNA methyltransferase
LARVEIVLVRPESPANVGAAARVVRNTGLHGLVLVDPGDWRTVECWRTAWGAHEVLEHARTAPDLASALAGTGYVAALSGRRPAGAPVLDVRRMAEEVAALGAEEVAALVFGPETAGLSDAELAEGGRRVLIPADPAQPSLNLSHAVMIAAYEVFRARRPSSPASRRSTHAEKEAMLALLREGLQAVEALPAANRDGHFQQWRALFQRADLTPKEVRLLEHMARKMKQRVG